MFSSHVFGYNTYIILKIFYKNFKNDQFIFIDGDIANRSSYNLPVFESETINGTVFNYTYDEDIQACNLTSEADDLVCVEDVMYQLDNSVRNCTCRPNCQELDYEVYISQSKWPSKFYQVCTDNIFDFIHLPLHKLRRSESTTY